jgi:hypothetical protein
MLVMDSSNPLEHPAADAKTEAAKRTAINFFLFIISTPSVDNEILIYQIPNVKINR